MTEKPIKPTLANTPMTSPYGMRVHPITGESKMHNGTDYGGSLNDPLYAVMSGTVRFSGFVSDLGNFTVIEHNDDNLFSGYAHANSLLTTVGQSVTQGQTIARMGTTGDSTGVHLHFTISDGSEFPYGVWQNSDTYLASGGGSGVALTLQSFVHSLVSNDFGLSIDLVAEKTKSYGRFASWLNGDVELIKQVLTIVKNNGVSPAFFASYEKTEGYNSSWGWLNHTAVNGNPFSDADSVSKWLVSQSKDMSGVPAWIDYANFNDFVPSDVKATGNADFENMLSGSIGRVVIAGTAAATWEVYYPNGLKAEYNGVQDYGAPITGMMETIIEWGGTGGDGGDGGTDPVVDTKTPLIILLLTDALNGWKK